MKGTQPAGNSLQACRVHEGRGVKWSLASQLLALLDLARGCRDLVAGGGDGGGVWGTWTMSRVGVEGPRNDHTFCPIISLAIYQCTRLLHVVLVGSTSCNGLLALLALLPRHD